MDEVEVIAATLLLPAGYGISCWPLLAWRNDDGSFSVRAGEEGADPAWDFPDSLEGARRAARKFVELRHEFQIGIDYES
jgi:hypothetical protein